MREKCLKLLGAALLAMGLLVSFALAEEAAVISAECKFRSDSEAYKFARLTDGDYAVQWQSGERRNPYLTIQSKTPMHGLYLCFREMPESYELQRKAGGKWETIVQGDTRFHHVYYELDGESEIRLYSTQGKKHRLVINELFVLGEGEVPAWVQRWEETEEKADLLLLAAHPGDELMYFGGAIPTYAAELDKSMVIAYLTYGDKIRRSEALNGLWSLGVRNYPVFGDFPERTARTVDEAYKKADGVSVHTGKRQVLQWVTELFRKYRPEVVLTHDLQGEDGNGQHMMAADACIRCFNLAANPGAQPESALLYGPWEVRKLYLHGYGGEEARLHFAWDAPLESQGGKTGMEAAEEAFSHHLSQTKLTAKIDGRSVPLSVREVGGYYENTVFGLYLSRVGADADKNDFLENCDTVAEEEVVHISDVEGLLAIAENPDGSYVLDNDIDLAGVNWTPLRFSGTLDGNGFAIRNLQVNTFSPHKGVTVDGNDNRYETSLMGFFSQVDHATVRNIHFVDATVRGETDDHAYVAIVAALASDSAFVNVSASGSAGLSCGGKMAGVAGLVGFGCGFISDCRADITLVYVDTNKDVKCEQFLGGAVANGFMNCFNITVNIDGYASVYGYAHNGGVIGMHYQYKENAEPKELTRVTGCKITGAITFFEYNSDRRAYCRPIIGEQLDKYAKLTKNDITGFKRKELKKYNKILLPDGWSWDLPDQSDLPQEDSTAR